MVNTNTHSFVVTLWLDGWKSGTPPLLSTAYLFVDYNLVKQCSQVFGQIYYGLMASSKKKEFGLGLSF